MKSVERNIIKLIGAFSLQVIPLFLIVLFAYTGTSKLIQHHIFLQQLDKIKILHDFKLIISYFIPLIEIITAMLLLFDLTRYIGLLFSVILMMLFTVYVLLILSGNRIPCSCGGIISKMNWTQHLYFNSIFLILSLTSLSYYKLINNRRE